MEVILHCSDSAFGNAVMIDNWHREKGFKNDYGIHIGYHLIILNGQLTANKYNHFFDGLIETGRAFDDNDTFEFNETAAATLGKNNCIQIVLIGKSGSFTTKQWDGLVTALRWCKNIFHDITIKQHSDFDPVSRKYCAGIPQRMIDELQNSI